VVKLTDQQIAGMTRQQLIDLVRKQEGLIECVRHLSVLVRPPEPRGVERTGRGKVPLRQRIDEAWKDLDDAIRGYYGGPIPVIDGELDL
jgi:hypothetical protein